MGFLYLAIKIPQLITTTLISNLTSHLISLIISTLTNLGIFKSPPDPDDYTSSANNNYILILDGSSPSLLPVPVHAVTAAIKNKVPIVSYSEYVHRYGGDDTVVCSVCLECIESNDLVRELCNCKHVFHQECLDRWVDEGHVNCPLCRTILLPPKRLLAAAAAVANPGI